MSKLEWALQYASRGWAVFPIHNMDERGQCSCARACSSPAKHPRTPDGFKSATTDQAQIRSWWTLWPEANIGMATGSQSGVYVIDLDMPLGPVTWNSLDQGGDIPAVSQTGSGGQHLFYKHPGQGYGNTAKRLGAGIDTRGDGGYVLLPPSNHASGSYYMWLHDAGPAPMPGWLLSKLDKTERAAPVAVTLEGARTLTEADLRADAMVVNMQNTEASKLVASDLLAIADGRAWGVKGARGDRLYALCLRLNLLGFVDPSTSAELFSRSCAAVEAEDQAETTTAWVADLLRRTAPVAAGRKAKDAERELDQATKAKEHAEYLTASRLTEIAKNAPKAVAKTIRALRDGASWSEGGPDIELSLSEAARYLMTKAPDTDVETLVKLCGPALAAQGVLAEHLASVLKSVTPEPGSADDAERGIGARIRRAFLSDRTDPYTADELDAMQPLEKRWLVDAGGSLFVRGPLGYVGPMSRESAPVAARDLLSPAQKPLGVDVYYMSDKQGLKLKSSAELLDEYGLVAQGVEYNYAVPDTSYDSASGLFVRAAAKRRPIAPRFNAEIDRWLELFCLDKYETVLEWLASFTDLSRATAGLYMESDTGTGKNLMALGLARLFEGASPVSFQDAWDRFNDGLRRQPVVYADESLNLPPLANTPVIDALKMTVTDESRMTQSKGKDAIRLHGCLRLLIGTNNKGLIRMGKRQLHSADLRALESRLIVLRPGPEATDYLEKLGGRAYTDSWVAGDGLAAHVLWLQERLGNLPRTGRYLVEGTGGLSAGIAAGASGTRELLEAMVSALVLPASRDEHTVRAREGEVWFNTTKIRERWATLSKDPLPEDMQSCVEAITQTGTWGVSRVFKIGGGPVRMRAVHLAMLRAAAARMGYEDELQIELDAGKIAL